MVVMREKHGFKKMGMNSHGHKERMGINEDGSM
jgi:hypothetical protein